MRHGSLVRAIQIGSGWVGSRLRAGTRPATTGRQGWLVTALFLVGLGAVLTIPVEVSAGRKGSDVPQIMGTYYGGFSRFPGDSNSIQIRIASQMGERLYGSMELVGYVSDIPLRGRIARTGVITLSGKSTSTGKTVKVKLRCGCQLDPAQGRGSLSGDIAITGTHAATGSFFVTGILNGG